MPPALHPRSSMTLSLFTSTLAISFFVVGLPHVLPCPVRPKALADESDPQRRRRRRKLTPAEDEQDDSIVLGRQAGQPLMREGEVERMRRECPVPKPGGLVGQLLGVKKVEGEQIRPVVRIERFEGASRRVRGEREGET